MLKLGAFFKLESLYFVLLWRFYTLLNTNKIWNAHFIEILNFFDIWYQNQFIQNTWWVNINLHVSDSMYLLLWCYIILANQNFDRKIVHISEHCEKPALWAFLARACSLPFQRKNDLKGRKEAPPRSQVWTDPFRRMIQGISHIYKDFPLVSFF